MAKKSTREVEYYRCWSDQTWDTDFLDIPADTPDDQIEAKIQEAAASISWLEEPPCFVGLYCSQDDAFEEDESDDEDH